MLVKPLPVTGIITTNSYFYIDQESKHGFLIDAGAEADKLLSIIAKNNWKIEKILLTHGHFDHIGAVAQIAETLQIPYFAHKDSHIYLENPQYNLSSMFGDDIILPAAEPLNNGDKITLKANPQIKLQVIYTPGHTQDSLMYYDAENNLAFVGDTIFKNSIGRTDIPGGDETILRQNILNKILTLPEKTVLYSGHTSPTTVQAEKRYFQPSF